MFLKMTGGKPTADYNDFFNDVRNAMTKQFNDLRRYFDTNKDGLTPKELRLPKKLVKDFLAHAGEDKKMSKSEFFKYMDFQMEKALKRREEMEEEELKRRKAMEEEALARKKGKSAETK